ncbi:MAG: GIY-YIG nuclease family protein [Bacteroidales bacterium]|nr:GIY-YIG nuclease family protein [Bacteroidales bacterium]
MYWVYIIENPEGLYYKGYTQNVEKRLYEHNAGESRYTSGKGPWKLVYKRSYLTKTEALKEERRLKRLNSNSIKKLIEQD